MNATTFVQDIETKRTIDYVQVGILSTIMVFILAGNIFIMVALKNVKTFKLTTKVFIFSLCLADLSVGAINLPLVLNEVFQASWTRTVSWCKLSIALNTLNLLSSKLNLVAMAFERLFYIIFPFQYEIHVTNRKAIMVVIMLWIITFITVFMPIYSGIATQHHPSRNKKDYICKYSTTLTRDYMIAMCCVHVLPLIIFPVLYIKIICVVSKQVRRIKKHKNQNQNQEIESTPVKQKRTTILFLSLIIIFYICWFPYFVAMFLNIDNGHLVTQKFIFALSTLVYSNSFLNTISYYLLIKEFRDILKHYVTYFNWKRSTFSNNSWNIDRSQRDITKLR